MHGDYEVILVDNASTDETVEKAKLWPGPIKILELSRNHGFGAASNVGIRKSTHDAIVLLNPDSLLIDDSLLALAQLALREDAICGPELLNVDGSRQPSASAEPAGWEVVLTALFPARLLPRRLRERCEPWRSRSRTQTGWLTGACLAAPKNVLMRLGPFHERPELYGEDMELGLRGRRAGVRSIYAPDVARVIHLAERSARRRFGEGRATRKIASRRRVVRRLMGSRRERVDHAAQFLFHASRYATKSALRNDASRERRWLEAAASVDDDR